MNPDRVTATYLVESPRSVAQAAEILAGEMSTGTFIPVPGETEELKERYRTRVVAIEPLAGSPIPAFPQPPALQSEHFSRARVTVSIPYEMVGSDLTTVLASVVGNITELREVSALRLVNLELPAAFLDRCALPRYGVDGTRGAISVQDRPLIGGVIKPAVGLTPGDFAARARLLAEAGVDLIKDDELLASPAYCPFEERVTAVMRALNEYSARSGRRVLYAFNLTADLDTMLRRAEFVSAAGGLCGQVNLNQVGLVGVAALRRRTELILHGHTAGWGLYSRQPFFGMDFQPCQLIWRLVGVDHLVIAGPDSKFWLPNDLSLAALGACLTPLRSPADRIMPAVGSRQWGGQAPMIAAALSRPDLIYLAGAGIFAHPGGAAAGVAAIRQAWDAALSGAALDDYAASHPELAQALRTFAPPSAGGAR